MRDVRGEGQLRRRPRGGTSRSSRGLSPEITSLYDAIMRDGALSRRREATENAAMSQPSVEELEYAKRMEELALENDSKGCVGLLSEMGKMGVPPTPSICLHALYACVRDFNARRDAAGDCMQWLDACPPSPEKDIVVETSRSLCGLFYKHRRQPWDVLRTMGWKEHDAQEDVVSLVHNMNFRQHSIAWNTVGWALNKLGMPGETIRLLNAASEHAGLRMNVHVGHVMIEALGALGRIKDADSLLSTLQSRGEQLDERIVGLLLGLLSSEARLPNGRRRPTPDPDRVRELCSLIPEPSLRMMTSSIRALACANLVDEADLVFSELQKSCKGLLPDERSCMTMMRLYSKLLINGAPVHLSDSDSDVIAWREDLLARADALWVKYFDVYGHVPPSPDEAHARITIFPRYVLAKSMGGQSLAALELLRDALRAEALKARPWFRPDVAHFQGLLFGIGRTWDAEALDGALKLMVDACVELDESTISDAMLTLVGVGDCVRAAKLLVAHSDGILASKVLADSTFFRCRKRLLNRVDLVADALVERSAAQELSESSEVRRLLVYIRSVTKEFSADTERRRKDVENESEAII